MTAPDPGSTPLLQVNNMTKHFEQRTTGVIRRAAPPVKAPQQMSSGCRLEGGKDATAA